MISRQKAYQLRRLIEKSSSSLSDEEALEGVELFPHWVENKEYVVGDRVSNNGTLFKCLIGHQSQSSWIPQDSPSLWVRLDDPSIEFPEWVQPLGSTDAYPIGAKVSHNNKHWISDIDNNVYEPSVYGWTEV